MQAHGGLITLEDLKDYQAVERAPLRGHYRDYEIITAPPPSAGGVGILQMLGMLEGSGYEKTGAGSAASIHYVAEVMRRFYADRSEYFGDPDFYKVPVRKLLDPRYIASRRASIDPQHATPSEQIRPGNLTAYEGTETTHFNIVDDEGNAVAVTYTLNSGYGSGVTVPGLGFLLNDEMDDFAAKPGEENMFHLVQGEANAIQPGKRPLSAMTPTILLRDGKLFMVLGAPGGSAHHQCGSPGDPERGGFSHEHPGRRRLAALSPPMDAGSSCIWSKEFLRIQLRFCAAWVTRLRRSRERLP